MVWVPTPQALVDKMLDMAKLTPNDIHYDLGSGDGRTVITAAKRGATAFGVEFNPKMVELSRANAEKEGVTGKATFVQGDIFQTDFSKANVITLFLLPELNERLRPTILDMKPGTRVVSNSFSMGNWQPDERAEVTEDCRGYCRAMLWIVPAKVDGAWTIDRGTSSSALSLKQEFQTVTGTISERQCHHAGHRRQAEGRRDHLHRGRRRIYRQGRRRHDRRHHQVRRDLAGETRRSGGYGASAAAGSPAAIRGPAGACSASRPKRPHRKRLTRAAAKAEQAPFEPQVSQDGKDVVWWPTANTLVNKMLDLAKLTPKDKLIDLGSGDGRTVITAAQRGSTALGIEYNPKMVELSRFNAKKAGVSDKATFRRGDIFKTNFSNADVLTLFLLPELNERLRPTILRMKPGTRVVSNTFEMGDWEPDQVARGRGRLPVLLQGAALDRAGPGRRPVAHGPRHDHAQAEIPDLHRHHAARQGGHADHRRQAERQRDHLHRRRHRIYRHGERPQDRRRDQVRREMERETRVSVLRSGMNC